MTNNFTELTDSKYVEWAEKQEWSLTEAVYLLHGKVRPESEQDEEQLRNQFSTTVDKHIRKLEGEVKELIEKLKDEVKKLEEEVKKLEERNKQSTDTEKDIKTLMAKIWQFIKLEEQSKGSTDTEKDIKTLPRQKNTWVVFGTGKAPSA